MSTVAFAVDQAACIRCGACVLTCPPGAVSVQGVSGPGSGGWGLSGPGGGGWGRGGPGGGGWGGGGGAGGGGGGGRRGRGGGGGGDRRLTVDPGRCSACWACTEICPTDAIAPEGAP